jgi:nucleoside-triphosphatase THEP1
MSGMAGTGKTTIACTFAKWLEQEELLAASFFCTRMSADCRDVTRIIPTVAYQLARYSMPFQSALYDVLGKDPDIVSKDIETQFKRLLIEPLQKVKNDLLNNLVVVIDALDECDDQSGVGTILDMFFEHASQLRVRFFVTSRPEVEIYSRMKDNAECCVAIYLHDIEKSLVKADIGLYLREELAFMGSSLSDNDLQQLIERSGALFIYAATLVGHIRPATRKANSKQRLRSVLGMTADAGGENSQIDALYTAVLKSAIDEVGLQESEKEDIRAVLRTVLFSQEPVPVETIVELSGVEGRDQAESAMNALRSVLHHSEITGLVSTLHASFPDFMFNKARSKLYHCDIVVHAPKAARRCFMVMRTQLRFNICDLPSSFVPDDKVHDMQDRIKSKIPPALSYACRYWVNHLTMSAPSSDVLAGLSELLSYRLLFWMEVMSLKKELVAGVEGLLIIKQWLAVSGLSLSTFLADCLEN